MSFLPNNQSDFEKLATEYSDKENTACLFASVKDGDGIHQGVIGDMMAVLILLVVLIRQIAKNTDSSFSDIIGALTEIDSMEVE